LFYGDHDAEMVNGTKPKDGSSYAYQYLTASILVDGRRLTIVLTPIKSREHVIDYVKDALNRIRNMGVRVRYLLFDGGFSCLELPSWLGENGYRYAVHFTPNAVTKRMGLKDGEATSYPSDRPFQLVRVDDQKTKISYLFATNMTCRPKRAAQTLQDALGSGDHLQGAQPLPTKDEIEELHAEAPLLRRGRLHLQRVVHPQRVRGRLQRGRRR
jgi:hypothetical protein